MGVHVKNEIGNRYGRLVVLSLLSKRRNGHAAWLCQCDCGKTCEVFGQNLRRDFTKSCGCLSIEKIKDRSTTHGFKKDRKTPPLYNVWAGIKQRCYNSNNESFHNYGGRGILIAKEWENDFASFARWIESNLGSRPPRTTLDRIDNDEGYVPGNLRWANSSEQNSNRRPMRSLTKMEEECLVLLKKYDFCNVTKLSYLIAHYKENY